MKECEKDLYKRGQSPTIFLTKNRRGQFELSFGMIFAIILIIIFIGFAFYAINKFLELQDTMKIAQFGSNLQSDIDKVWKSSQSSNEYKYILPSKIDAVCFRDDEVENLIFQSKRIIKGKNILHIDIEKTIGSGEQLCINNTKGEVKMIIKKGYGEALVTIAKQ